MVTLKMKLDLEQEQEHRQRHTHGRNDNGESCLVTFICGADIDFYSCIAILLRYFMDVQNRFIVGKVPNLQQFGAICQYDQQTSIAPLKGFYQPRGLPNFCQMPAQVDVIHKIDFSNNT